MKDNSNFLTSIIRFFIENYKITYLLIFSIIIFGLFSIYQIPKESSPEVNIPVVAIITPLPGAGAENVEELITKPIENQISGLSDIEKITSNSRQGLSSVIVQFNASANSSEKLADIRTQVSRARTNFPRDAGEPIVQKISFSDIPIMSIVLSGPYELSELKVYADQLKDELENIRNISDVIIVGAPEREIRILLNEEKIFQYGISTDFIIGVLSRENIDFPVGSIETGNNNYSIRINAKLNSAEEIRNLPLVNIEGALIRIRDIADVHDDFTDIGNITRFSINGSYPEPTLSLQVFKESGEGDILTIANLVKEKINNLTSNFFPSDIKLEIFQSDAETIKEDLIMLVQSIFFTVIIILLILALFLGWRDAFIASIVVPFSFLITFIVIDFYGLTINFLTLFSLVLSLGILVDVAIVITESIFEKKFEGKNGKEAAIETIKEFQSPLIAGTLTTVFVFLPMLIVSGVMGEFIKSIPITVSTVLVSSLFVSLFILTTITTRFSNKVNENPTKGLLGAGERLDKIIELYISKLSLIISKKRFMYIFLGVVFFLFLLTLSFPFLGIVSVNMFPSPNSDTIFIDLKMPIGTPLRETNQRIKEIEEKLINYSYIKSFLTYIGQSSREGSLNLGQSNNSHIGSITITLEDKKRLSSQEIIEVFRNEFGNILGAEIKITQVEAGPNTGGAIQINIIGKDLGQIEQVAVDLSNILSSIKGVDVVDNGIELLAGEFVVKVKRDIVKYYGITTYDIAETLRSAISGKVANNIKIIDSEIDVVIYSNLREGHDGIGFAIPISASDIYYLPIQTQKGIVSLENFIDIELGIGRGSINRQDGERIISITSNIFSGYNSNDIVSQFRREISGLNLSSDVKITYGGEIDEIRESFIDLFKSMIIGVILIFALMVLQFHSYKQSFFIILTIPFASIGVFGGLAIVRVPLSFPAFIGIVALSGIVVNNAIILIDTINKRYNSKIDIKESILEGAKSRFRPVILTTITTVFGLIPLVFVGPVWAPVAYSIIFGLIFSTILTLFVIPILYYLFERK